MPRQEHEIRQAVDYADFLQRKTQLKSGSGFAPVLMPKSLFDFQGFLVDWALTRGRAGIFADCGMGKGQPRGSNVLTPTGWVAIGELCLGDRVISSDGMPSVVTGVYPKAKQDTFRIWFSDGVSFVVDRDHLHICRTNNDRQRGRPWQIMSTEGLLNCGNLRYGDGDKSRNYDIPVVRDVQFDGPALPIDPYLLGALLGDGTLHGTVQITTADDKVRQRCADALPEGMILRYLGRYAWSLTTGIGGRGKRNSFRQALIDLGLLGRRSPEKFIPESYLFADATSRLELLRGLMDTDGYIAPSGSCQFYSASEALTDGVIHLVRSLGGVPTKSVKDTACNGKPGLSCYMATFSLATHNPFFLSRKAERWNSNPRDNGRWIDRIEFEGHQETVCIAVDSPDSSYVTEHFIVTHNSLMALTWCENVLRHTNKPVLIVTPIAVGMQFESEGEKFGIECHVSRDGKPRPNITITNYERLHLFDPQDYVGVVCDESGILKHFSGATQKAVTRFLLKTPYRLLCTATPSPNDYTELGTSSEALGHLSYSDMLSRFFVMDDKKRHRMDVKLAREARAGKHFAKLAYRVAQQIGMWRLKGHAEIPFWKWVCSWARACRMPSDLGFPDDGFVLPELIERDHIIDPKNPAEGMLFVLPAFGLGEEREERRRTLWERCEFVADLVDHDESAIIWCHMNSEGDLLEKIIPDAIQVKGANTEEEKEEAYRAFISRDARVLVIKPKIGAWGMNFQHCAHVVTFITHSYESHYQSIRRCWRFGQKNKVIVDRVATKGESRVRENMVRKSDAATKMFAELIRYMNDAMCLSDNVHKQQIEVPSWLKSESNGSSI